MANWHSEHTLDPQVLRLVREIQREQAARRRVSLWQWLRQRLRRWLWTILTPRGDLW